MSEGDVLAGGALSRRGAVLGIGAAIVVAAALPDGRAKTAGAQSEPAATPESLPPGVESDFKVVFHAADVTHWPYVISNLRNLRTLWPQARLRVVVDGTAVYPLQGANALTDELTPIADSGVEFQVCPNALREHRIDPDTIPTFATTSLGGVVALVAANREGFVYVKP
jgi:intracellular sulfur oxidation DsrE/DsrF family protein